MIKAFEKSIKQQTAFDSLTVCAITLRKTNTASVVGYPGL